MVMVFSIALCDLEKCRPFILICAALTMFFLICSWVLILSRKLKWRHREVLELAAMPVNDDTDGYTSRPSPTGKAQFSEIELSGFTRFLLYHLIAIPHIEEKRVVFSLNLSFRHRLGILEDYTNHSYVAFDSDGNVSTFVSKSDYLKYQNRLAFDQLNKSLGNLFIEFLELFKGGEGIRILDRMNALKLHPMGDFAES
jgi:hypothetical protein